MNIFIFELKKIGRSTLLWVGGNGIMLWLFMALFPSFASDTAMLDKMLKNYPEEMLKAFGMNSGLPLSSVGGYFVFAYAFIQLLLAMQAANLGFGILSVEERDLTADFLLTRPISRTKIYVSKLLAAMTALTITNACIWGFSYWFIDMYREGQSYDGGRIGLILMTNALFQLFFVSIGLLVTVLVKKIRSVISFSMATAFGLYMLNALRSILDGKLLGMVSPFYHYDPVYMMVEGHVDGTLVLINVLIISVSLGSAYLLFLKRNIHSL